MRTNVLLAIHIHDTTLLLIILGLALTGHDDQSLLLRFHLFGNFRAGTYGTR